MRRTPPPLPAFDAACRGLLSADGAKEPLVEGLGAARTEAVQAATQSLALAASKLRAASAQLREAGAAPAR